MGGGGVYRLFDSEGVLLYIGSSSNPDERIKSHLSGSSKLYGADKIRARAMQHTIVKYPDLRHAQQAERAAIYAERPLFNLLHNSKRFLRVGKTYFPVDYAIWPAGPAGRIMQRMAELGLTGEQVSQASGISANQITPRRFPMVSPGELAQIAQVLGMDASSLTERKAAA